jgi:hypothetical protein
MERLATLGIGFGWLGTLATLTNSFEGLMKVLVAIFALFASVLGAIAAYYVAKTKRAELRKMDSSAAYELARLCEQCRAGHPPPLCPLPKIDRPKDCPHPEI